MSLVSQPIMFFPIIFIILIIGCFSVGNSIDCGGNVVVNTITVDQQNGTFNTIQAAIDSVKSKNDQWIKIHINPGTYKEKVYIPNEKPCIILEGSGSDYTTITYGANSSKSTSDSATFSSSPSNVVVVRIAFENTAGADAGPAVAAIFYGEKTAIIDCSFVGYQDTLYDAKGRHFYKNCYIQGEVDFIFGTAQSYYQDCLINATQGVSRPAGFVAAQHRNLPNDTDGFVFRRGSIVGNGKVNLGRAWGPYSRVIFWETKLTSVVTDIGWDAWGYKHHEGNLTFAEVDCEGEGSKKGKRVAWEKELSSTEMTDKYSFESFVNYDGWYDNIPKIKM